MANSGFPGVYYAGPGKYRSRYRSDGKTIHLGTFATAEKAHEAYKKAKARDENLQVDDKVTLDGRHYKIEKVQGPGVYRIGNGIDPTLDNVKRTQLRRG